jgi:peptide/nickel transport system substrate-binding protein
VAHRYDRRTFLGQSARTAAGLAVVGGAGGLLAACGATGPAAKAPAGGSRIFATTGNPKPGGSLTFGVEAEESGFDPTSAHFDSTGVLYARTVYDPLAIPLADGTVVPYLAQSITPNTDYTQWTITLRPNLFFHDGNPCDGSALLFNMQQYIASPLVNYTLTYVDKVVKAGDLGVTIFMKNPWVPFDKWLAGYIGGQCAYVFSPAQWSKASGTPGFTALNNHPIGTGPFVFKEWVANDHFTATKNPNYWRKDAFGTQLPYLDSITFRPLPIVAARWQGLEEGQLDIIHTDDPRTILDIRAHPTLQDLEDIDSPVEHDMDFGMINTSTAPFNDVRMRQAFAYGFNQQNYLEVSGLGVDGVSNGPFGPGSPYFAPTGFPTYNLAKAKSLLQSYLTDTKQTSLQIQYGTTQSPTSLASAGLIQQYMSDVGATLIIQQVEQSEYITDAVLGHFHVFAWRQFANIDPDLNYPFWASEQAGAAVSVNFTKLSDPIVQKSIDTGRQSTDPAERVDAYQTVAKQFGTDCPYIWASEDVWAIGAGATVHGFDKPTVPDGRPALGMLSGIVWPTEIWKS